MSKIEELTQKLCPEGVSYIQLKDVATPLKKETLKTSELVEDGRYPVMNSGRSYYGRYDNYNNEDAITIAARGEYAGYVNYNEGRFWAGGLCYPYKSINEKLYLTKYIFYALKNQQDYIRNTLVAKGSIPALNKQDIDRFKIPVPPLEVQQEIVRVLNSFTELEAELTKRKKQYEFYKEQLFNSVNLEGNKKCVMYLTTERFWLMPATPRFVDEGFLILLRKT